MSGSININSDPKALVSAGDMSGSIASIGIDLQGVDSYAIQAVYTGSPVGTLKLQLSTDAVAPGPDSNVALNVVNWSDYTGSSLAISAAGDVMYKIDKGGERWVRLIYTRSSGSGTLNATFNGKS